MIVNGGNMAKVKTVFVCNNCGFESSKWLGKCPSCSEWNTFYEESMKNIKAVNANVFTDNRSRLRRETKL